MEKRLDEFKKGKLFKALKILGLFLVLVVLYNIYSNVFLRKTAFELDNLRAGQGMTTMSVSNGDFDKGFGSTASKRSAMEKASPAVLPGDGEFDMMSGEMTSESESIIATPETEKRVIKNGFLTLKVEATNLATDEISKIVAKNNGEIFSSNFNEYTRGSGSGTITVKVPVANFQSTMTELKTIATQVVNETTSGQDVTEQYVDLQAQLKNKKAEEQTFVSLLERAGDLDDVLNVSREIARVRGEIERLEGRIKYLESQTAMSTIVINISEDIEVTPISDDWRPGQVVKKALNDLKGASQDFVDGTIHFFIVTIPSMIPFVIFLAILYWIGKKISARFFRK
jgi:hypothetical protein